MIQHIDPSKTKSWKKLHALSSQFKHFDLKQFAEDEERASRFQVTLEDIHFNYARNHVDQHVLDQLFALAEECELAAGTEAMFNGTAINETEGRAVLHTALRSSAGSGPQVNGKDVLPDVRKVLAQMERFSRALIEGTHRGYSGKAITDVVNIGIGGSDLGPSMVYEALKEFGPGTVRGHFVSNVDGIHLHRCLRNLQPDTTLFIIASKSFTTQETMANAQAARNWFLANGGSENEVHRHFVALSTNLPAVKAFGISEECTFGFWNWVGGRYSLWSAIGLSLCCTLGFDNFRMLLRGAERADVHFRTASPNENIPIIMGLLGIWYNNFLGLPSHAILPYDQRLSRFPAYLQQADMESNGKRTDRNGNTLTYESGPLIWGEPGTNGQHAFYQLLHQGTKRVPCDFIAGAGHTHPLDEQHRLLLANFLAQPQALMNGLSAGQARRIMVAEGRSDEEIEGLLAHRTFPGNRPSNILFFRQLDPMTLGTLIALYEHKIFVQGWIWNIYSFDQWGVELGKKIASGIVKDMLKPDAPQTLDAVGRVLLEKWKHWRSHD